MSKESTFKQTEIGQIPENWNVVLLKGTCSKIGSGLTPRGGEKVYKEKGTALIRSQNVFNNRFVDNGLVYIGENIAKEMENVEVQKQDVLLNITGDSVARCCTVPDYILPARVNQHVSIIRTDRQHLNPIFLRYYLTSPKMQDYMLNLAQSGGTRNALTKGMIENFAVPQPEIKEQEAISNILSKLDLKITLNEQTSMILEVIGQTLFKHWFVDFEFPNEEGKPYKSSGGEMIPSEFGEIPKNWYIGKYSDLVEIFAGKGLPRSQYVDEGKYPILGANGELSRTNEYNFNEKLILIGRVGTLGQIYLTNEKVWISDNVLISKPKTNENYYFAYFVLKSFDMESLNRGSTQPLITQTDLKNQIIILPDKQTLIAFQKVASSLYCKINKNNSQINCLSQIRDLILPKLMSGKIRVSFTREN